jgi:hypothetical protein
MIGVVLAAGLIVLASPVRRGRDLPTAAEAVPVAGS